MTDLNSSTIIQPSPELEHIKSVWQAMLGKSAIYEFLLSPQDITLTSASKGKFTAQLKLSSRHVNSRGTIHGGVSATIVDWAGGLSIASYGFDKTGASIDIHVTYLSTANINDIVEIEGAAAKVGKSIAFTTVKITKLVNGLPGPTVALGSHTKAGSFLM